jgi:hypothetical protein
VLLVTTLFASDPDMFVFLADEENRIELPGRRAGRRICSLVVAPLTVHLWNCA